MNNIIEFKRRNDLEEKLEIKYGELADDFMRWLSQNVTTDFDDFPPQIKNLMRFCFIQGAYTLDKT